MALCLEVKSTSDGTFHLSRGEWERAEWFRAQGKGDRYAVLVVHRASGGGPPKRLDLLPDPVRLVETGQLTKTRRQLQARVSSDVTTQADRSTLS